MNIALSIKTKFSSQELPASVNVLGVNREYKLSPLIISTPKISTFPKTSTFPKVSTFPKIYTFLKISTPFLA